MGVLSSNEACNVHPLMCITRSRTHFNPGYMCKLHKKWTSFPHSVLFNISFLSMTVDYRRFMPPAYVPLTSKDDSMLHCTLWHVTGQSV